MQSKITTARQMRMLLKEEKKRHKLAEKKRKANEMTNPKVVSDIIELFQNSHFCLVNRYVLVYGKENEALIREVYNNFDAYKRAFRKLGYKLRYESDCSGRGFSVSF